MNQHVERAIRVSRRLLDNYAGLHEPEERLIADAQAFWSGLSNAGGDGGPAHWRGQSIFADDARWWAIGANSLRVFEALAGADWLHRQPRRVLDWGCGGGTCAVHFAPGAARYYALDITAASLGECQRQLALAGLPAAVPVLVPAADPEAALALVPEPLDLVLSTYVFELLPSQDYGRRVLLVLARLLAPGGLAFVQIKYTTRYLNSRSYRWGYAKNMGNMTTYYLEEFWDLALACGLPPQLLHLEPRQPLNNDAHFGYFLLQKPD